MNKLFAIVFVTLFSPFTLACTFANYGPEFDALIIIKNNEEPDSFYLEVPKKLENTGSANVYLSYSKVLGNERIAEFSEELKFWFSWGVIEGDFSAPKKEGYVSYIHVVWPGEVCDTVANSGNLEGAK